MTSLLGRRVLAHYFDAERVDITGEIVAVLGHELLILDDVGGLHVCHHRRVHLVPPELAVAR